MTNIAQLKCQSCYASLNTGQSKKVICSFCGTENILSEEIRTVTANSSGEFKAKLRRAMIYSFGSLADIKILISELNAYLETDEYLDYDDLSGDTVGIKCLNLINWCFRRGELQTLVNVCLALRPRMDI